MYVWFENFLISIWFLIFCIFVFSFRVGDIGQQYEHSRYFPVTSKQFRGVKEKNTKTVKPLDFENFLISVWFLYFVFFYCHSEKVT
jgi:hypothetical protein